MMFFHQLRHIIIGKHIRNGCLFYSNEVALRNSYYFNKRISCSWDDSLLRKHNIETWEKVVGDFLGKLLRNSRKLREVVAIYKTNKLVLSKK